MTILPVILAGGSGERLWPLSKTDYPKQFVAFEDGLSLFQHTVLRVADDRRFDAPLVVCHEDHRFLVADQLRAIDRAAEILLEPRARNTAPAVALAAWHVQSQSPDRLLLVLPSDHRITEKGALFEAVERGRAAATAGRLLTFGVLPRRPDTGYGYIQPGAALDEHVSAVGRFHEKPSMEEAETFVREGTYFWNSGIFFFTAAAFLRELETCHPALAACTKNAMAQAVAQLPFLRPAREALQHCEAISIDHAVMERTAHAAVAPVEMGWDDLGSWNALYETTAKDEGGNAVHGEAVLRHTQGCYVHSRSLFVAAVGLRDLVIVAADHSLLIADRHRLEEIRPLMRQLSVMQSADLKLTGFSPRPWGTAYAIDRGERYRVKRLHLKPGGKISLQTHRHRAEHWVVVKGVATVTNAERTLRLQENESTYIPAGTMHRLENAEADELIVIEVQTGDYLGDDDICRHEDLYHRS